MTNRYARLFTIPEKLYTEGSPVLIAAGALLKDNQTGKVLAQLKLQNIVPRTIKAASVVIAAQDAFGRTLGEPVGFQYLDFAANRNAEFGQKWAIPLPDENTRRFTAAVTEVAFADNDVWESSPDSIWEALPLQQKLSDELQDSALLKQYQSEVTEQATYEYLETKDRWLCVCGENNAASEENCACCGVARSVLKTVDLNLLKQRREQRLAEEKAAIEAQAKIDAERAEAARQEAERQQLVKQQKKKKRKKAFALIVVAIVVVAALTAGAFATVKVIIPNQQYDAAAALMREGDYEGAIAAFEALDGYKDSDEQIAACETAIMDQRYADAVELMDNGEYDAAITALEAMEGYQDSENLILTCREAITEIQKRADYDAAVALMEDGNYEAAIAAFEAMDGYENSAEQIIACETAIQDNHYDAAVALMESGSYEEALEAFKAMDGYKDSEKQKTSCEISLAEEAKVGSTILFGSYEQDGNVENGQEEIEWIVLAKEADRIFVISKYGLDTQQYQSFSADVTWASCELRTWMNGTFFDSAFSTEEQNYVPTSTVWADVNPDYDTSVGNNTQDKVFLLSALEANRYLQSDAKRMCIPTVYAVDQGAKTSTEDSSDGTATVRWWTRTAGSDSNSAVHVQTGGAIRTVGSYVQEEYICVRPAMWIEIPADDSERVVHKGWVRSDNTWHYYDTSGNMLKGWLQEDDHFYYFDNSGSLYTGWYKANTGWRYFDATGVMTTGWLELSGNWYWFDSKGLVAANKTVRIDGKNYRFSTKGVCLNP